MQEFANDAQTVISESVDDIDLLLRMTRKDTNRADAETALAAFFQRYQMILICFAEKQSFRALGWCPEDFVLRTFEKAYEKAGSFKVPSDISPQDLHLKIKGWLFQIAKNEFFMEFRKPKRKQEAPTENEIEKELAPLPEKKTERFSFQEFHDKKAAVRTFLEKLPDADRELLEVSMSFYDFAEGRTLIPEDILEGLAESMRTTPECIKTKRGRLLHKLEDYLRTTTT